MINHEWNNKLSAFETQYINGLGLNLDIDIFTIPHSIDPTYFSNRLR